MVPLGDGDCIMIQQTGQTRCPCGAAQPHDSCCGCYLSGERKPETAEQLMRSRYCGFVFGDENYLLATWAPETRPSRVRLDDQQRWLGLSIRSTHGGGADDHEGQVEFVARFKVNGKGHRLHEKSRFRKIDGEWRYVDGEFL